MHHRSLYNWLASLLTNSNEGKVPEMMHPYIGKVYPGGLEEMGETNENRHAEEERELWN